MRAYRIAGQRSATPPNANTDGALPLPDKPSLAVLPFTNMSGDPEQEYFSDGMTEDIITELSRFRTLFVIARNSSFTFKGQAVNVAEVGRKLGVEYVIEGSVRRAARRVRITAQLIEAASGKHVWAERYDRDLTDIFDLQDEMARTIVTTAVGRLEDAGAERARRKPTRNMAAYDYMLQADQHLHRWNRGDLEIARSLIEKAIALEPNSVRAQFCLGMTHIAAWIWGTEDEDVLEQAERCASTAMAIDENDSRSHVLFGHVMIRRKQPDAALNYLHRAVALNPNDATAAAIMGRVLDVLGRHEDALEWLDKAMRFDPFHPDWMFDVKGQALYMTGRYEDAAATFDRIKQPPYWLPAKRAACHAQLDRPGAARQAVAELETAIERERADGNVKASVKQATRDLLSYYKEPEDTDHWRAGLRKAGLPV